MGFQVPVQARPAEYHDERQVRVYVLKIHRRP